MSRRFHEELEILREKVLKMSRHVQDAIDKSITALLHRTRAEALLVFEIEKIINLLEIEIDDMGHSLLVLGQPAAADLRLITTILKINTDLERLGDHAVNIAERALYLMDMPPLETNIQLPEMAGAVQQMLQDALDSFLNGDAALARRVLESDDEVDAYNNNLYAKVETLMQSDPLVIKSGMRLVRVGHDLERIGDLANNIAEDVVYMKQGKEVRHHTGI